MAGRWVAGQATAPTPGGEGVTGPSEDPLGTMYRIVTDFHGGWYGWGGLQQSLMIQGNFSAAGLNGANGTWPDPDMVCAATCGDCAHSTDMRLGG